MDNLILYETLLIIDMFTENYNSFSKHLRGYVINVLHHDNSKRLTDNVNTFTTTYMYNSKADYINIFDVINNVGIQIENILGSSAMEYVNAIRNMS